MKVICDALVSGVSTLIANAHRAFTDAIREGFHFLHGSLGDDKEQGRGVYWGLQLISRVM